MRLKPTLLPALPALAAVLLAAIALHTPARRPQAAPDSGCSQVTGTSPRTPAAASDPSPTGRSTIRFYGHNLLLRQGPALKIYIPWLRGELVATHPGAIPSLDERDSFHLQVGRGVVRLQLQDLSRFLNSGTLAGTPFHQVSLAVQGEELVMHVTVHKIVPLRATLTGSLRAVGGNRVAFHMHHLSVLKVPMGGLLGVFHFKLSDIFQSHAKGIEIAGDTVYFNAETLPPAPHLTGEITRVQLIHDALGPAIETIYGGAKDDRQREQRWRDFLQLEGGTLRFGRLTMQNVDLILIDADSKEPWFYLDLARYQTQLVYGITRVTPEAGLQIFMPSLNQLPNAQPSAKITREWLQNRYLPAPPSAPVH